MKYFPLKPLILACLTSFAGFSNTYAAINAQQLPFSADPYQKWQSWQTGANAVQTPELRDGNVYNLTPAQLIYYAALENKLNPMLLLVKLQAEQSLIKRALQQPELGRLLKRAAGFDYNETNPTVSDYPGFYPQLAAATFQFAKWRTAGLDFQEAFHKYTPHERKYIEFVNERYPQYAAQMNTVAGKSYATYPASSGYFNDFQDITAKHIQQFLNAYSGNLKNVNLFPADADRLPRLGPKIVSLPSNIPSQINQNDTFSFTVKTDKPAAKVSIVFSNPDAEKFLTSTDSKVWAFSQQITVPNNRPWLLRVYNNGKISDERFGGNLQVVGETLPDSLADWQKLNINYAQTQHDLYGSKPLTNVYGQKCGYDTWCFLWSRHAPGSLLGGGMGAAYNAFVNLKNDNKATEDNDFAHAPIGAIVFYGKTKNNAYGHAGIKIDETHVVSQGQFGRYDCMISKVAWDKIPNYVGYYAPAPGSTTLIDPNIIPKAEQVTRGQFLTALAAVLETASPDLPDVAMEKATLMGLVTDPLKFNPNAPILRQDAARMMARAIAYFEINKRWFFAKTGNSNQFAKDAVTKANAALYPTAVRMAELGLFAGVLQEDGSYKFEGLRQLSKTEKGLLLNKRLPALFAKASAIPTTGYSKIANDGSLLADTAVLGTKAKEWACTRDNVTGFVWEVKTDDGGLRDKDNRYSWYDPNPATNGGFEGYSCTNNGASCDTNGYAKKVNLTKLCGYGDWRVPNIDHLKTLVDIGYLPTINPIYFPNTSYNSFYWSSSTVYDNSIAWGVYFNNGGGSYWSGKVGYYNIRLVRGGQ